MHLRSALMLALAATLVAVPASAAAPDAGRAVLARRAVRPEDPHPASRSSATSPAPRSRRPSRWRSICAPSPRPRPSGRGWSSTPARGRAGRCGCWSSAAPSASPALDQVKADIQRLADPRGLTAAEADRLDGHAAGGRVARARRARQRDQLGRRGAARGLSPAGGPRRCRRRRRAARRAGAHRPDAESRRPRALHLPEPAGARRRRPTRRPTTPSTTSRGRAAARTTTCST